MTKLAIVFLAIAVIAVIGAIICLIGGIISNRRWSKRFKANDNASKASSHKADLLKSIDKHLKHIDLSLAAIAIDEHDEHNDPLSSIKLGLLSSPHDRYIDFIKTLEGKTHEEH